MRIAQRPDGKHTIIIKSEDARRGAVAAFISLSWIVPFRLVYGYPGFPDYSAYYQAFNLIASEGRFPAFQLDYLSSVHFWLQLQLSSGVEEALANTYNTNSALICIATAVLTVRNKVSLPYLILFAGIFTTQMHVALLRATPAYFVAFFAVESFLKTRKTNFPLMLLAVGFHSSAMIPLLAMVVAQFRILHNSKFLFLILVTLGAVMLTGLGQSLTKSGISFFSAFIPGFSKYLYYIFQPNSTSVMDLAFRILVLGIGAWVAIFRRDYPTHFRVFLTTILIAFLCLSFSPNIANRAIVYGVGFAIMIYQAKNKLTRFATSAAAIMIGLTSFIFRWYWFVESHVTR